MAHQNMLNMSRYRPSLVNLMFGVLIRPVNAGRAKQLIVSEAKDDNVAVMFETFDFVIVFIVAETQLVVSLILKFEMGEV